MEWVWIGRELVLALHDRQLAEHGGPSGVRDPGALESALARPLNLVAYGEPDVAALAASYAFGIARLFLRANGIGFSFDKADAVRTVLALAAGDLDEDMLAAWFRAHIVPA